MLAVIPFPGALRGTRHGRASKEDQEQQQIPRLGDQKKLFIYLNTPFLQNEAKAFFKHSKGHRMTGRQKLGLSRG
jgi:hypothetical protein